VLSYKYHLFSVSKFIISFLFYSPDVVGGDHFMSLAFFVFVFPEKIQDTFNLSSTGKCTATITGVSAGQA